MQDRLVVNGLYKVFGDRPDEAMAMVHQGIDKKEIFARTGHTLGVNNASFTVREGEIFVVMGLSGSGKSTLVRLLNRLIDPTAGQVLFDGTDIAKMNDRDLRELRRKHMSMVFQSFALMPHLSVVQNAAFGLELAGEPKAQREEKAMKALHQVGLGAYGNSYPHELSGGMQQRVGLARALANDPTVLLMDEAFSALDPLIRMEMQGELIKLQERDKRTIIFISHDIEEAFRIGDRIAIMEGGIVVQVGTAEEIIRNPANDYIRNFFKNVDTSHVFAARDLSRMPDAGDVYTESADCESSLERLSDSGHEHAFVLCDQRESFRGVISVASLRAGLRNGGGAGLQSAYLPDTDAVPPETPISQLYQKLAASAHDLPVVDDAGLFHGVVSKGRVIDFLGQRDANAAEAAAPVQH